ncbi:hypothetical protein Ct61P_12184 [Colletotrichum tofieldiae]|nr:hypothetical protein Ct61P_12184 [Colletotrichum tofieldiae]
MLVRTTWKVRALLWVVNEHDEDITVVVAKYRPNRLLKAAGIDTSATSGGLSYEAATPRRRNANRGSLLIVNSK